MNTEPGTQNTGCLAPFSFAKGWIMRRLVPVVLLSWWFIAVAGSGASSPVQFGPFDNEQSCNRIRGEAERRMFVTSCWFEGAFMPKDREHSK